MENDYTAYEIVGDIKKLREAFQLTQQTLAEKAEVSAHTVQNWEYGKYPPKKQHIKNIIKSLKLHERDYPELFAYAEVTEEKEPINEAVNEVTADETLSKEAESPIPQADVAISEVSDKKAASENAKLLITILKEKWLKICNPFFIGVGVWGAAWIIIAIICVFAYNLTKRPPLGTNETLYYNAIFVDIDMAELAPYLAISLLAIIAIFILTYFIIRKVRKK